MVRRGREARYNYRFLALFATQGLTADGIAEIMASTAWRVRSTSSYRVVAGKWPTEHYMAMEEK